MKFKKVFLICLTASMVLFALSGCFPNYSSKLIGKIKYALDGISVKTKKVKKAWEILYDGSLREIIKDLSRHNSFSYINYKRLTSQYFDTAAASLGNGYIYLIITKSKSPSSEVIGLFTNRQYNHVSISFDQELQTIISYNGGGTSSRPGLNPEILKGLTKQNGSKALIYRLPATYNQKKAILNKITEIDKEGNAYNLLGLIFKFSYQPNIMFCSQFVYTMLKAAGLNYFEKPATHVQPTDFVELDYYRKLEFVIEITFDNTQEDLEVMYGQEKNCKSTL